MGRSYDPIFLADVCVRTGQVEEGLHVLAEMRVAEILRACLSTATLRARATEVLGNLSALPIGSEIAAVADTARQATLQEVMTALTPFVVAEAFVIPAESHVVLARR